MRRRSRRLLSYFTRIQATTLIIAGGEDLLTPDADTLALAIAGTRQVTIAEAGHAVTVEAPEAVNEALLAHLSGARTGPS